METASLIAASVQCIVLCLIIHTVVNNWQYIVSELNGKPLKIA